ncbi:MULTISPECIES: anti-sigma-F factor Fin family protein [Thalassobacillus]|uniref:anti-sigma-F factor Fin family protein n=1 Tax=Thalassobacillus TaxID=331971 RepID=UPI000A1CCA92|nr:anti-sigma-F factor Fin family protein [Thalassobacillus devorans]
MSIIYVCRHCNNTVGKLEQEIADENMLGINHLTEQEREEMLEFHQNGDLRIKTICDNCQEALDQNPQYHELDFFIQ